MFAELQDVLNRYEGELPTNRHAWVETRINDVEVVLLGLVPSLAAPDVPTDRRERAKILVCDKVLELYRNPDGSTYRTETYGSMTDARSFSKEVASGRLVFTADELRGVRLPVRRRTIGSIRLSPWGVPR